MSTAGAEPSSADKETSRGLYAEGLKALEATDYKGAEKACRGAFRLVALPTPAVCLARALVGQSKLVEARDVYLGAARTAAKDGEPAVIAEARETARAEGEKLAARIPTLVLEISGAGDAQLRGSVDGEEMAAETIRLPRRVNPGKHVLVVGGDGFADERVELEIAEGERKSLPILLRATSTSTPTLGYVGLGVGAVGLVVGGVFAYLAVAEKGRCTATACDPGVNGDQNSANVTTYTIVAAIGGAALIGGVALWLFAPIGSTRTSPSTAGLRVTPWIGLGTAGVAGRF